MAREKRPIYVINRHKDGSLVTPDNPLIVPADICRRIDEIVARSKAKKAAEAAE